MPYIVVKDTLSRPDLLDEVLSLWRTHSDTLGFLPAGAFREFSEKGQILVAIDASQVVGYLLFAQSRRYARITHLCVSPAARGQGVAEAMFEELKKRVSHLDSVTLNCRRDFSNARNLWDRLGFEWEGCFPGRSASGSLLETWRFPLSALPLLRLVSQHSSRAQFQVVVDCNVFSDLTDPAPTGIEADWIESNALHADVFADTLRVEVTNETKTELSRITDPVELAARIEAFNAFPRREYEPDRAQDLLAKLRAAFPGDAPQHLSDLRQVSKAAAADADAFVTRDEQLLSRRQQIESIVGIRVMRPMEVILALDEDERPFAYQPSRLGGTSIQRRRVSASDIEDLAVEFLCFGGGEKKAEFRAQLQTLLTDPSYEATIVTGDGVRAFWIAGTRGGRLHLPVIRVVGPSRLASTLAVHVIWSLVRKAARNALSLEVTDTRDEGVVAALRVLEFVQTESGFVHVCVEGIRSADELSSAVSGLPPVLRAQFRSVVASLNSPDDVALCERLLFPAKVARGLLPTFVVPIRPSWARELFDTEIANADLFGAQNDELKLAFENAYYRSAKQRILQAPARVLWYVSKDPKIPQSGAIRAVSQVREVLEGPAKAVYSELRRLGVYEWKHVRDTAGGSHEPVRAFRFSHTELLPHPISFAEFQSIAKSMVGKEPPLVGPWRVEDKVFAKLYSLATEERDA